MSYLIAVTNPTQPRAPMHYLGEDSFTIVSDIDKAKRYAEFSYANDIALALAHRPDFAHVRLSVLK